jgi:leader peptidase (prepilin peptidase)/N-methyltransferase
MMILAWAVAGAVLGVLAGAALRGPVFRLSVPSGEPERTACPRCGTGPAASVAIRCRECGGVFGPPWVFEVVTAVVLALVCARFAGSAAVLAFGFLGMLSVALSGIDIAVHRLPDKLTLPAYPVLLLLLGIAAVAGHSGAALLRALLGGAALTCAYFLLAVLRPGQLGAGDVKLAGLTGLALGWLGWPVLILGAALAFLLSAFVSLGLLAARRISLRDSICFGPFMLGGALVAILVSGLAGFLHLQGDISAPVVTIRQGSVRGSGDGTVVAFRGIPYAASPVGSLRFRPPARHPGWSGTRDGSRPGPAVPQGRSRLESVMGPQETGCDEEGCLNLNVWTPTSTLYG